MMSFNIFNCLKDYRPEEAKFDLKGIDAKQMNDLIEKITFAKSAIEEILAELRETPVEGSKELLADFTSEK
jgi:hypothetical protein